MKHSFNASHRQEEEQGEDDDHARLETDAPLTIQSPDTCRILTFKAINDADIIDTVFQENHDDEEELPAYSPSRRNNDQATKQLAKPEQSGHIVRFYGDDCLVEDVESLTQQESQSARSAHQTIDAKSIASPAQKVMKTIRIARYIGSAGQSEGLGMSFQDELSATGPNSPNFKIASDRSSEGWQEDNFIYLNCESPPFNAISANEGDTMQITTIALEPVKLPVVVEQRKLESPIQQQKKQEAQYKKPPSIISNQNDDPVSMNTLNRELGDLKKTVSLTYYKPPKSSTSVVSVASQIPHQLNQEERPARRQGVLVTRQGKASSGSYSRKQMVLFKIQLVRRVVSLFERLNAIRRFSTIPPLFYAFFGDKSARGTVEFTGKDGFLGDTIMSSHKKTNDNKKTKMKKQLSRLVLFEDSKWVIALKILVIMCCTIQCVTIPLEVAFSSDSSSFVMNSPFKLDFFTGIVPAIIFLVDIYVNFNLAYYFKGKLVCDRKEIACAYFFGGYWFDLASIVLSLLSNKSIPALVIRIYVLVKELERILAVYQIQEKYYYAYRLIELVTEVLLSCHLLACVFIMVAYLDENNWITSNGLEHSNADVIYCNSLYYIIVTMTTIGYGDIHPISLQEKTYFCIVGFISSGIFAYNLSVISSIVYDSILKKIKNKKLIMSVTEYMTERSISRSIQNQILHQLHYNQSLKKNSPTQIEEYLKHVSENLKGSLFHEYFGKILLSNRYLKRKFSKQFLSALIPKFKEEVLAPGSELFSQGDHDDRLIYLRKGNVILTIQSTEPAVLVHRCVEGEWLCLQDLFTGDARSCSAKISEFTSIVYISRAHFLDAIQPFPRDQEVFHMIKDKVRFSGLKIEVTCELCKSLFHSVTTCPFMHFTKKREYIIQKHNYSLTSQREPGVKRRNCKFNALTTNDCVRYQLKNFRMNLLLLAEGITLFEERNLNQGTENSLYRSKLPKILESKEDGPKKSYHFTTPFVSNKVIPMPQQQQQLQHRTTPEIDLKPVSDNFTLHNPSGNLKDSPVSFRFTHHSFCWIDEEQENISNNSNINNNNNNINIKEDKLIEVSPITSIRSIAQPANNYNNHTNMDISTQVQYASNRMSTLSSRQQQQQQYKPIQTIQQQKPHAQPTKPTGGNLLNILPVSIETDEEFFSKYDGIEWSNDEVVVTINNDNCSQFFSNPDEQMQLTSPQFLQQQQQQQQQQLQQQSQFNLSNNRSAFYQSFLSDEAAKQRWQYQQFLLKSMVSENPSHVDEMKRWQLLIQQQQQAQQQQQQQAQFQIQSQLQPAPYFFLESNRQVFTRILGELEQIRQQQNENLKVNQQLLKRQQMEVNQMPLSLKRIRSEVYDRQNTPSLGRGMPSYEVMSDSCEGDLMMDSSARRKEGVQSEGLSFGLGKYLQNDGIQYEQRSPLVQQARITTLEYDNNTKQQQQQQQGLHTQFTQSALVQKSGLYSQSSSFFVSQKFANLSAIKAKDKLDFWFFIAFERQNNWQGYFPKFNLNYIVHRHHQHPGTKRRSKKKKSTFLLPKGEKQAAVVQAIEEQEKQQQGQKYRRLSQLVQKKKKEGTGERVKQIERLKTPNVV